MLVTSAPRSQGKYPAVFVSICDGLDTGPTRAQTESDAYFDRGRKYSVDDLGRYKVGVAALVHR